MAPARMKRWFALVLLAACGGARPARSTTPVAPTPATAAVPKPEPGEAKPAVAKPAETEAAAVKPKPPLESSLRWRDFPGPNVPPPVETGVARVVAPIQGSDWHGQLAFYEAKVLRVEGNALAVEGVNREVFVPGAFVALPADGKSLKVGALVRFQERPGLYSSAGVGRIAKVAKTADGIVYTIKARPIDEVETSEVPAANVRPIDGKLAMGQPVSFEIEGKPCLAMYVAPGRDAGSSWVLSVGHAVEKTNVKPLVVKPFAKGAKVRAMFGTTSQMKGNVQEEPRQYLEDGTVVEVLAGGLAYKVKDGSGEITERSIDEVFVR